MSCWRAGQGGDHGDNDGGCSGGDIIVDDDDDGYGRDDVNDESAGAPTSAPGAAAPAPSLLA